MSLRGQTASADDAVCCQQRLLGDELSPTFTFREYDNAILPQNHRLSALARVLRADRFSGRAATMDQREISAEFGGVLDANSGKAWRVGLDALDASDREANGVQPSEGDGHARSSASLYRDHRGLASCGHLAFAKAA
jgi:hypothetical protein